MWVPAPRIKATSFVDDIVCLGLEIYEYDSTMRELTGLYFLANIRFLFMLEIFRATCMKSMVAESRLNHLR